MDTSAVEQIGSVVEAEIALSQLNDLARAVLDSPGGKRLTDRDAVAFLDGLDADTLNLWRKTAEPAFAVLMDIVGKILTGEATAKDLRVFAHKALLLTEWQHPATRAAADSTHKLTDAELSERLRSMARVAYRRASAAVRSPGPPLDIEAGYEHDGY